MFAVIKQGQPGKRQGQPETKQGQPGTKQGQPGTKKGQGHNWTNTQFFLNLDLGTFSWFSWELFHGHIL